MLKWGIYKPDSELIDDNKIDMLENIYGRRVDIVSFYRAWNNCHIEDDIDWIRNILKTKREVLLTFEPWDIFSEEKINQERFRLKRILSGIYDDYIKNFFLLLKQVEDRLYLRPMHEMNGNWYPWCGTVNENSPLLYRETFRYIHNIAKQIDFKPKWVFCPYVESVPDIYGNFMEDYFPGDNFIDYLGLDGYNWGIERDWSRWKSFEEIFLEAYKRLTDLSAKQVIICETATTNRGGNKKIWVEEMFKTLKKMDKIVAVIWFDVKKECDWRYP